jgi:hypothetical protein
MTDNEALEILRAQGYAAGTLDLRNGLVRVWIHGSDEVVAVRLGRELCDFAEAKLTFDEILERRQSEVLSEP